MDLPENEIQMFLKSDKIKVETEDVLFTALVNWTNHNLPKRQEAFPKLFGLLRLQSVTKQFLSNTVRKEKLVRDSTTCRDLVEDAMHFHIEPERFEKQQPRIAQRKVNKRCYLLTPKNVVQSLQLKTSVPNSEEMKGLFANPQHMIVQPPFHISHLSAIVLHENKVMFFGGAHPNNKLGTTSIISFDEQVWKLEGNLNFPRAKASAVSVKGAVYIFGGTSSKVENRTEMYVDGHCLHDMPKDLKNNRLLSCAVVIGGIIYLFGNNEATSYQPWQVENQFMFAPRNQFNIATTNQTSVDAINTQTNEWSIVAPLNFQRTSFTAATVGNTIYVFGGCKNNRQHFNTGEFLDTSFDNPTWTLLPPAPVELRTATSFLLSNEEIIVLGGRSNQLCCFSTRTHTWKDTFTNCQQEQEKLGEAVISSRIFGFIM
uniref:Kelch-like protein 12 n=1 Tax=Phallusia mammillata TaxID=59560 RepID=A0A6F9DGL0_9ASCI|nr:kelch-like protein 12 [Phallusia mammillata]